jgi:hypothetical protein
MKKLINNKSKSDKQLNPTRCPVGRPSGSNRVRVVPVFRDEIDIRKLGRLALKIAIEMPSKDTKDKTLGDTLKMRKAGSVALEQIIETPTENVTDKERKSAKRSNDEYATRQLGAAALSTVIEAPAPQPNTDEEHSHES